MPKINKREFRHAISVLKKRGLIPASVDARTAEPYYVRSLGPKGGKFRLDEFVKKHQADLESKPKRTAPKPATGIEVVDLNVPYHDLEKYLRNAASDSARINKMKRSREYFAFKFFGHQSMHVYEDIDLLIEDLLNYDTVQASINKHSARDMNEMVKNLSVVRVPKQKTWGSAHEKQKRLFTEGQKRQSNIKRKKKFKRAPEWKKAEIRSKAADRQKKYRENLSDRQKDAYNKAGQKRAAKSRDKKK